MKSEHPAFITADAAVCCTAQCISKCLQGSGLDYIVPNQKIGKLYIVEKKIQSCLIFRVHKELDSFCSRRIGALRKGITFTGCEAEECFHKALSCCCGGCWHHLLHGCLSDKSCFMLE